MSVQTTREEEYRGHEIEVTREPKNRYRFELIVYVDGDYTMSATALEKDGVPGPEDGGEPWTPSLVRHAKAYIDGLEDSQ